MQAEIKELDFGEVQKVKECFLVFVHLRPHLTEEEFMRQLVLQKEEGYRVVYVELNGQVVAASGYRLAHFLAWGKVLYIDDLITHPEAKRQGHGGFLLDWLLARARAHGCDEVHLDTGHHRHDAHRLYLNKGFVLSSHHMSVRL